jgi:hypothetical protein
MIKKSFKLNFKYPNEHLAEFLPEIGLSSPSVL